MEITDKTKNETILNFYGGAVGAIFPFLVFVRQMNVVFGLFYFWL